MSNEVPNGNVFALNGCSTDAEKPCCWADMSGVPRVCAEQLAERFGQQMCTRVLGLPGQLKVKNKDNRARVMERDNIRKEEEGDSTYCLNININTPTEAGFP